MVLLDQNIFYLFWGTTDAVYTILSDYIRDILFMRCIDVILMR